MTILTISPASTSQPDSFEQGIADARHDTATMALDFVWVRAQWMTDPQYAAYTDPSYLLGYTSTVAALTRQIADETAFAYTVRALELP